MKLSDDVDFQRWSDMFCIQRMRQQSLKWSCTNVKHSFRMKAIPLFVWFQLENVATKKTGRVVLSVLCETKRHAGWQDEAVQIVACDDSPSIVSKLQHAEKISSGHWMHMLPAEL